MCQPKICLHCGSSPFSQILPSVVHLYGASRAFVGLPNLVLRPAVHAVAVSINGCLTGWLCSLLISNVVPGISRTTM